MPGFGAFYRLDEFEMGTGIRGGGHVLAVFSTRQITSPFLSIRKKLGNRSTGEYHAGNGIAQNKEPGQKNENRHGA